MTVNLADIKGFCFDFDGVFYDYKQIDGIFNLCDETMAQSACKIIGEAIDFGTAKHLAREGYATYGDCITAYCEWGKGQGIEPESFRTLLFKDYHSRLKAHLHTHFPKIFTNRLDLISAFELSRGRAVNGVATHSCATNWAKPFLRSMGISEYFSLNAVHGLDEAEFALKHTEPRLVEMSFASMGVDMREGSFVEDSAKNLEAVKELSPRTRCILLNHGTPLEKQPTYIDNQFRDIPEMKKAYAESLLIPSRIISLP